jgi:hypothetical protein
VLNRGWIDKDDAVPEVDEDLDADGRFVEHAEEYETKFNFRFEELAALEGRHYISCIPSLANQSPFILVQYLCVT